jgi:hypothetical protein
MIECPVCHAVSHHPVDAATGWCARCERFTGKTADEVRAAAREQDPAVADAILHRLSLYGAAVPAPGLRARALRWFRWNARCHRGRRCAILEVSDWDPDPDSAFHRSLTVVLNCTCGTCGTEYREEVLLDSNADAPIPLGRERVG